MQSSWFTTIMRPSWRMQKLRVVCISDLLFALAVQLTLRFSDHRSIPYDYHTIAGLLLPKRLAEAAGLLWRLVARNALGPDASPDVDSSILSSVSQGAVYSTVDRNGTAPVSSGLRAAGTCVGGGCCNEQPYRISCDFFRGTETVQYAVYIGTCCILSCSE